MIHPGEATFAASTCPAEGTPETISSDRQNRYILADCAGGKLLFALHRATQEMKIEEWQLQDG